MLSRELALLPGAGSPERLASACAAINDRLTDWRCCGGDTPGALRVLRRAPPPRAFAVGPGPGSPSSLLLLLAYQPSAPCRMRGMAAPPAQGAGSPGRWRHGDGTAPGGRPG